VYTSVEVSPKGEYSPDHVYIYLCTSILCGSNLVLLCSCMEESVANSIVTALNKFIISFQLQKPGYVYSRIRNPTIDACAEVIAQLEGAQGGTLLTSSGMAAISLVFLTFLKSGDHLVSTYILVALKATTQLLVNVDACAYITAKGKVSVAYRK